MLKKVENITGQLFTQISSIIGVETARRVQDMIITEVAVNITDKADTKH